MKQLIAELRADTGAYDALGKWYKQPGYWIVAIHRLGCWAKRLPWLGRVPAWVVYRVLHLSYHAFNIELWAGKRGATLGAGVCLVHPNNLYFGPNVTLGDNCLVHHEVTLGMGTVPGTPQLGQNVVLYPGARVQGGITIGDDVIIGANCVVTRNIAPNTVVQPAANRMMPRTMLPKSRQLDRQQQEG